MAASWSEDDSAIYRKLLDVAVPAREEQIAALVTLLPVSEGEEAHVVELGCGTGALAFAILDAFSGAKVTALDGSASMRAHAAERLRPFGRRFSTLAFDLEASEWLSTLDGARAVVSSLVLHHLDDEGKWTLFRNVFSRLDGEGALLISDLVAPQTPEARELFATSWDRNAEERSRLAGDPSLWELFREEEWNVYRFPDPVDRPSPLFDQLLWLSHAGFAVVDCFCLQAGHAVYGGYRSRRRAASRLPYARAIEIATRAIEATR